MSRVTPYFAALSLAAFAAGPAHALEPFSLYDTFKSTSINPALWTSGERVLTVKGGALNLMQRTWGGAGSDSGLGSVNLNENFTNPTVITAMRAKITVNALEVNACPSNSSIGQSRARIVGSFFNVGTPTPGSQIGDSLAQIKITRFSNSTDAPGVLRVQGLLSICDNADCSIVKAVGSTVDLGTVTLGQAATVQLQWDKPSKTFLFSRDSGAFTGTVTYTQEDTHPASSAFKTLSARLDLPNCLSAPRVPGLVDASFDNIAVNQSAAP